MSNWKDPATKRDVVIWLGVVPVGCAVAFLAANLVYLWWVS